MNQPTSDLGEGGRRVGSASGAAPQPQSPWEGGQPQIVLTPEERSVLRECNRESFFRRALPFGLGSMVGVWYLGKQGILRPNPAYGMAPKMMAAGFFAYFFGKVSYTQICADKMLEKAPDGQMADTIRAKRGLPPRERLEPQQPSSWDEEESTSIQATPSGKTYEELRRQHRESQQQQSAPTSTPSRRSPPAPEPALPSGSAEDPSYAPPSKLRRRPTNKYGDEGFE